MRGTQQLRRGCGVSGLLVLALVSGCSGKDCCAPPQILSIQLAPTNSGDQQKATVGSTLPQPLRVLVRRGAEPASGVEVTWSTTQGHLSSPTTTTDASGIASARWTLDTLAGQQSGGAEIQGGTPPDTAVGFSAMANPGPASQLRFAVNPTNTFTGQSIRPAVLVAVLDVYGNPVNSPTMVRIALGAHAGSGMLSGTSPVEAIGGLATFSDLSVDQVGTGYTLTASIIALPVVTSAAFEIVSPGSGLIAFNSGRDGNDEIYVMNADGSGQVNLTRSPGRDDGAVWSPDGLKMAFYSDRDGKGQIYVMNADGSGLTRLTTDTASDYAPAWSPDGLKLAFTSTRDGNAEIYAMNADGSGQVNLSNNPASDGDAVWSPDGAKIAFTSSRDGNGEVYVMHADGSNQVDLSLNPADDFGPVWSPDGSRMAFTTARDGHAEIYVMNADGSGVSRVTSGTYPDVSPVWSPDGTTIAFVRDSIGVRRVCGRGGRLGGGGCRNVSVIAPRDIYTVQPDGSASLNLTNNTSAGLLSGSAAWSPDGSRIAFTSSRDGNVEIYVMRADGSGAVNLTHNVGTDWSPVWKPR